jgi:DNA-binding transcriptional regulator YiaG
MTNVKHLQEKIKALRNKMSWAQEDLARQIGVSLSTVQRWETKGAKPTRLARRELHKLFEKAGLNDSDKVW